MQASRRRNDARPAKKPSSFRRLMDVVFFALWLGVTGMGGYFLGSTSLNDPNLPCPPSGGAASAPEAVSSSNQRTQVRTPSVSQCQQRHGHSSHISAATGSGPGSAILTQLKDSWTCSRARYSNGSQSSPLHVDMKGTKWQGIIQVEPDAFFDRYLQQYPGDMASTRPVIAFSHKKAKTLKDLEDCKVMDVAIIPDKPGVCIAVTETFHDVASYHMLHAQRDESTDELSLVSNHIAPRSMPSDASYGMARTLLLEYFKQNEPISKAMAQLKKKTMVVATLVDNESDIQLAENSIKSFLRLGGTKDQFFVIKRSDSISCKTLNAKCITVGKAANLGSSISDPFVSRNFLQAWLAFAAADAGASVLWQSPGTVWMKHPTELLGKMPKDLDTMFLFKGREDARAAPFHISTDLFYASSSDRAIHLLHEVMLHADLMIEWRSMDATASYRLSENNARYGTSTYLFPPHSALHTILMDHHSPTAIFEAATSPEHPQVIVFPRSEMDSEDIIKVMKESKLWLL
mmetsp:Transcript_8623/g.16156  ORF Transcript_8623/g.16156 Transcript_8623/m.16156 type:complete len:517 (+) Transcript_8623:120-1670(+)|eukprot:CAMPEP_0114412968 /NCGR_PEP_ID=MMETSP0103-20121206/607_1 /TAXON_ID=37642 ORGANISM="Paraphysomonas imperforata, Strain PA2" /NCGR_SAMPLE_ID=MMETSP0103 /ASSEMBLY_ACC=CAM_ASM_000201 /LENGTH=516 /DNA_ID=CAMNT_0001581017 /DNA_START=56 /DNA_END=1606 /DNA_ORIENTATION=-